jgi:hypothetical protein
MSGECLGSFGVYSVRVGAGNKGNGEGGGNGVQGRWRYLGKPMALLGPHICSLFESCSDSRV